MGCSKDLFLRYSIGVFSFSGNNIGISEEEKTSFSGKFSLQEKNLINI